MSKRESSEGKSKDPFAVAFGIRLRNAREAEELTQQELGSQIGAKKANISQWENGSHMPDLRSMDAICNVLKCSGDWLLGRALPEFSAAALQEARFYDGLPKEQQVKWRTMRLTLFTPA